MNKSFYRKMLSSGEFGLLIATIVLFLILTIFSDSFLTEYNLFNVARNLSLFALIGLSQAVVLVIGQMNLSVGAIAGLSTITAGYFIDSLGFSVLSGILIALMVGIICGAINGLIIAKIGVNAFVVTITTMFIFTGINFGFTQGYSFTDIPKSITIIGRGKLYGIPLLLIVAVTFLIIVFLFYKYLFTGRRSLAVGQNLEAARFSAINVPSIYIFTHILSGFIAAAGAMLFLSKSGSAAPSVGKDWLVISFAVAIIGGTALNGGRITTLGIFLGSAIFIMIKNGLVLLHLNVYFQQSFLGLLILIAIGIDRLQEYFKQKRLSI